MPPARLRAVAPIVPAGRPLLSREFIDQYRRQQVVAGVARAAHEVGLLSLRSNEVISGADLGRAAFYGVFPSKPEALSYACREASARIVAPVREARASSQSPAQRLAAGVEGFLAAVGEDPLLAERSGASAAEPGRAAARGQGIRVRRQDRRHLDSGVFAVGARRRRGR